MVDVEKWAKEIGDHCELAVGFVDKIFLPYSSRMLRDKSVENMLRRLVAEVLRNAAAQPLDFNPEYREAPGTRRGVKRWLEELAARYEEGRHD